MSSDQEYAVEPVGVRLIDQDGRQHPVQCVFVGWEDDPPIAAWVVVDAPPVLVKGMHVDVMPAHTSIRIGGEW